MKVAYIPRSNMAFTCQLATMILPQLEGGLQGAEVVGMFSFDDNTFCLRPGGLVAERLATVAREQCGSGEVTAEGDVDGVTVGCFPQLYGALGGNPPDQVITL